MMACDILRMQPDLALVKYKKLVGGGVIKIVNNTVPQALIKVGYTPAQADQIVSHIDATGTIEGAPHLKPEHLAAGAHQGGLHARAGGPDLQPHRRHGHHRGRAAPEARTPGRRRSSRWATRPRRRTRSSATSTPRAPSRARRT